ncbi:MAG: RNA polymerase sigma factor WhiG [Gemmatimonadota bacterium]|nr:MAG: RNA polymerase sigma factor WhiG [Gemmatimonadota bacterium]
MTKSENAEHLWKDYRNTRSPEIREKLVLRYVSLVKYVAGRLAIGLPPSVQADDLISSGILGLMDAIDKYDLERDTRFETYAVTRIRGAILDELRALDWIPRSTRQKARKLENAYVELENSLGRQATTEEIAKRLNLSTTALYSLVDEVRSTNLVSLDEFVQGKDGDGQTRLVDAVEDKLSLDPTDRIDIEDIKDVMNGAILRLPSRERLVIALYYYEELTLKEIGSILNVSESRISQIHTKAIVRLRGKLRSQMKSLVAGLMGPGIPQAFSTAETQGAKAVIGDIAKILAE